jgi:hypothetical protein
MAKDVMAKVKLQVPGARPPPRPRWGRRSGSTASTSGSS